MILHLSGSMGSEYAYDLVENMTAEQLQEKDKPRESVLAKLRLNQKKVAKQGKKQTQQKAMTEDMERKKK